MYINPFVAGVLCTIMIEMIGLVALAIYNAHKNNDK